MSEVLKAQHIKDLDYFQRLLEADSGSTYYIHVALMYIKLKQYDEAISVCRKGLAVHPEFFQLKTLYGEALLNVGRLNEALEILFDVILTDEDNFLALKLIARIYKATKQQKEAVKYAKAAFLKAPEDTALFSIMEELGALQTLHEPNTDSMLTDFAEDDISKSEFDIRDDISKAQAVISEVLKELSGEGAAEDAPAPQDDDDEDDGAEEGEVLPDNELTDEELINALQTTPPDEDLFDDEDLTFYDFNSGGIQLMESVQKPVQLEGDDLSFIIQSSHDSDSHDGELLDISDNMKVGNFIPDDLINMVFTESGISDIEDIFNEQDRITPDSLKEIK